MSDRNRTTISAGQKKRFASPEGKEHQKKMQQARWKGHTPLTKEQSKLANKLRLGGCRNPITAVRQMLAAEQERN